MYILHGTITLLDKAKIRNIMDYFESIINAYSSRFFCEGSIVSELEICCGGVKNEMINFF